MYIEIKDIPKLLNHVGYKGLQDNDSILKWLYEYDDGEYSRFYIHIIPYNKTNYYWYEAGCVKYYKNIKEPWLCHEPIYMYSGEPDGMNFKSHDEALKNAIIRCLMLIICREDLKCKVNGQYALLYKEQGLISDNTTLQELFKKYPYEYENSRSI